MNTRTHIASEAGLDLSREVRGFVGPDFMLREDAWEFVAAPSVEFLIALCLWEHTGEEEPGFPTSEWGGLGLKEKAAPEGVAWSPSSLLPVVWRYFFLSL